ncbi:putative cation-transporting ATPase 1 [Vanrija albida]|uniref:Cation-transporting ATPase 1 n=1 Tax=Vanrija albida TaxID=181172 RepID=A0ABR3QA75_9TREE
MSSAAARRAASHPAIQSQEIDWICLETPIRWYMRIYGLPFLSLYPLLWRAYYQKYDEWIVSEEWTFIYCVLLFGGHALSFLATRWSNAVRAFVCYKTEYSFKTASHVRVVPKKQRGKGEMVPLDSKLAPGAAEPTYSFIYQRDTYVFSTETQTFTLIPYPCDANPPLSVYQDARGILTHTPTGKAAAALKSIPNLDTLKATYGPNECHIPIPSFVELFAEHSVAPFFVFQMFCVALWMLDEYWYYSLFTAFMLVVFECTVVFQRVRTLTEFRTMSITPYPVQALRDGKWVEVISSELVPGDVISVLRTKPDSGIPCDLLLLRGTAIVNEAMLSGESTPLLKESIELREGTDRLDINGADRNSVLFSGTKALQVSKPEAGGITTPDEGCLAVVLRTGFGTTQGQLVRTMIFSQERVSANNFESFLFILFLLIFAIAASAYVWIKGLERGLAKGKLLLDCVLIITSVVPPELPMELSLAVNASLVALQKYAIFCTEPFRIPFAGRVDVCCFDKTGTITGEDLVVEGVCGVDSADPKRLAPITETSKETTLTLAAAHALVQLDDGTIVGDPMEKTTLTALDWKLSKGDNVSPVSKDAPYKYQVNIRRRFQFSSALKRMSTVSAVTDASGRKWVAAVKGAPETLKKMYSKVPAFYDETYRYYTRRGSRVLALGYKTMTIDANKINNIHRDEVESGLEFAGFLVFHCPLKPDAVETLKMLADSSHRLIMITGDNPLTAAHVARDVEIVDRDVMILDLKEGSTDALVWRNIEETKIVDVNPDLPIDADILANYDICITGAAVKEFEARPTWKDLVTHTWVYARVSPSQKEYIVTTLRELGYTTLMAGDGTNDVGALKQAHIGVALLDGTEDDLKQIAEHQRNDRLRKVYEQQCKISARFNQPPPPVPPQLRELFPELVKTQEEVAASHQNARKRNPMEKFDLATITSKLADMDEGQDVPQIKLGDASCAAPFTSKLSNVSAISNIIRQGRCTLVATIQMYKILALNCLITAYSLSVQYLDGIKFGDYQVTITGMLMSVCFLCISRAKPVDKLSRERPLGNIFNLYVLLSVLLQFAIHIVALVYITRLSQSLEDRGVIDLEKKFEPTLLNTAIYLLGLSQQVSTFVLNFQGRPFREGISENRPLYYGLLGASAVAYSGATDLFPELNKWLQLVDMSFSFRVKLTLAMIIDFGGCYLIEVGCKYLFADLEPAELVTRGRERREKRRALEEAEKASQQLPEIEDVVKKTQ